MLKQLTNALAGKKGDVNKFVKGGSIKLVGCPGPLQNEFRETVVKKFNQKHKFQEPVVLSLLHQEKDGKMQMRAFPGKIMRYPADMIEEEWYKSQEKFEPNMPGLRKQNKKTWKKTSWNIETMDDGKNWDCEPAYIQSPPEYQLELCMDDDNKKNHALGEKLREACAREDVMELLGNVSVLNAGVIEIALQTHDDKSDSEDGVSDDDASSKERDAPHSCWTPLCSVYVRLPDMTAYAEACCAMALKPSGFECEQFYFDEKEYRWRKKSSSKRSRSDPSQKVSVNNCFEKVY